MAFSHDLPNAARRNLQAAEELNKGHRRDVAGYLYGIAAECAVKQMMKPVFFPQQSDKNAAFFSHFPELRTRLRDALAGRNLKPLSPFINNDSFMNNWEISMRYADAEQIHPTWVDSWAKQARDAVNAMGT